MADPVPAPGPVVVVECPDEFDFASSGDVAERLRSAIAPGVSAVVADLTGTGFCDSAGVRIIFQALAWASADNVELRLVAPPGPALTVMKLVALEKLLPIYPTLEEALAGKLVLEADED